MEDIYSTVREILRTCPETRGDDKALILKVWEVQGLELTPHQKSLLVKCSMPESITRMRRRIQESEFKPSKSIQDRRISNEKEMIKQSRKVTYIGNTAHIEEVI